MFYASRHRDTQDFKVSRHTHTSDMQQSFRRVLHREGQATNLGKESRISMKPSVGVRL